MKRVIIIVVVVIALGIAAVVIVRFLEGSPATPSTPTGSVAPSQDSEGMPASTAFPKAPKEPSITIGTSQGGVTIRNFYLSNPPVQDGGNVILATTTGYSITYDALKSSFWVAISGMPFEAWRAPAEVKFLDILGISKDDACKLDVSEGVPYTPGNPLNGKSYPLSFCGGTPVPR